MVCSRQQQEVNVKVGGVAMVVDCLFEVDAIRLDLHWKLLDQNAAAKVLPAFCFFKLREHCPDEEESERFAGQVCVRTEVRRQVRLEMARVEVQELTHVREGFCR